MSEERLTTPAHPAPPGSADEVTDVTPRPVAAAPALAAATALARADITLRAAAPAPRRASLRFMLGHPARLVALGFGAGLSPLAPGTVGTLWAWLTFGWVQAALPLWWQQGLWLAAAALLSWWAATVTARHLGVADPGAVVCDEVVAFWLVLWLLMPAGFWTQAAAFALFRFFDAAKPGPVRWADRLFKGFGPRGGWGIVWDDLVAAFCTLLVMALWRAA